jgi:hypothetical protein
MPTFTSKSKIPKTQADTLVIHCSDYRIQAGIQEFLDDALRMNGNYDKLIIPGGPQSLTLFEYLPKFSWAGWKWFRYLVEMHGLKRLILIAHQDCAWYSTMPFHLRASSNLRQKQEEDLRRAQRALVKDFPHLGVGLYFAGWDADERMTIEDVQA